MKIHHGSLVPVSFVKEVLWWKGIVPAKGLIRSSVLEDVVDIVEICKICIDFHYPIWLHKDDGADEDPARILGQERLNLNPSDDIVQGPGHVEWYRAN